MHQIKTIDITQKTQTPFPLSIQVLTQTNNRKALKKSISSLLVVKHLREHLWL